LNTLEIILPLRNPTGVLDQTVKSIIAQTDRRFSILLSDNYSTQGGELIDSAVSQFQAAGIALRRVRPPFELGRVEHWNWAHYESSGDWLKPVFAGDWLEPNYVATVRAASTAHPQCRYIYVSFTLHTLNAPPEVVIGYWAGRFQTAEEMQPVALRHGMQFGPPSAAAYERAAFNIVGGYPTALPICSDCVLFCALASRFGALGLAEPLCNFNIHGARFSTSLPQRRRDIFRENINYYLLLGYEAWTARRPLAFLNVAWALRRETLIYFSKK
jgi:hypothetical protein